MASKRKVLCLGSNTDQIPYLHAARSLGFKVIATDRNAEAPGAQLANRFYCVGYTDVAELLKVAESEGFTEHDRVFTSAAHFAYEGAAHVAQELGIPFADPGAIDTCIDKTKFYAFLDSHDVRVPRTIVYDPAIPPAIDSDKTYYLKSDYGKSPKYCYLVKRGLVPRLPQEHDPFFRHQFLLQEAVVGTHYRVNLYANEVAVFLKFSDTSAVPLRVLGPGHAGVIGRLRDVVLALGLSAFLTKFDLIVNEDSWYVIDIGLDPPLRLRLLSEHLGFDFATAYTRYYLCRDATAIPKWHDICRSLIIKGSPQVGYQILPTDRDA